MGIDAKMLFESKLINIWAEATKLQIPYADRGFRFPTNLVTDSILFIGINPSYNIGVSHKAYHNSFYSLNQQGKNHRYPWGQLAYFLTDYSLWYLPLR